MSDLPSDWLRIGANDPARNGAAGVGPDGSYPPLPDIAGSFPRSLSILVVEDYPDAAITLSMLLRIWGHEPIVAATGEEALRACATPPDVVILDLQLPGMDGWEVAKRMWIRPGARRPLIVAVTGCGTDADRQRSVEAGIDLHLLKPVDPDDLWAILQSVARLPAPTVQA